jgi:hypothetical protein
MQEVIEVILLLPKKKWSRRWALKYVFFIGVSLRASHIEPAATLASSSTVELWCLRSIVGSKLTYEATTGFWKVRIVG